MLIALGLGLIVGVIMALSGAGGGILAVPLLMFGMHLEISQAAPVGLVAIGMAAGLGAILGLRTGIVRYRAALLMGAGGVLLAPAGVWLANRIDSRWLSVLFAFTLLFVAARTFWQVKKTSQKARHRNGIMPPCMVGTDTGRFIWNTRCARVLAALGSGAGLLSGLLGVGGGFVIVPALKRYTDLAMQSVIATSLAVIALVSISGVVSSTFAGTLDSAVAIPFSIGTIGGMLAGRLASSCLKDAHLQTCFAAMSVIVGIGMIVKALA